VAVSENQKFDWILVDHLLGCTSERFLDLVEVAQLDPATDFRFADLRGVQIGDADLRGFDFTSSDLSDADLRHANLASVNLCDANLASANLRSANLAGANLVGANLYNADLRQVSLIDSCFDRCNLTSVRLWETQRSGWSIKGVTCRLAFWDRDGKEATKYGDGDFERIFTEKPRIVLRYPGGISPVDLAMLPLIVERLQAEHPDCTLHIRSVQDDGSGAMVAITVEDLKDRSANNFAQKTKELRHDLAILQQRLRQEEELRLGLETKYSALIQDVLPKLLETGLPKTVVHVGQITGPTLIEGTATSEDTFPGQTDAVDPSVHTQETTFQQVWNQGNLDLSQLADELARLRVAMKQETEGTAEQNEAIGKVAKAEKAAVQGDGPAALRHLKAAGQWTLGVAEKIGVAVAVEAIKRTI
jgi:hypothetical protein